MRIDLHNHSCLSPCGSLEMSPSRLVKEAALRNIEMLALTDHNAGDNLPAFDICCRNAGIIPVYGMEVTGAEEAHLLCLFGDLKTAVGFGYLIYESLQSIPNNPDLMGDQIIVDEEENILGELDKHLAGGAVEYTMDELAALVHRRGGLFIPAHIDRPAFSVKSQLGFLPEGDWDAVEVMQRPCALNGGRYNEITGSDAHYPENVGQRAFELPLESGDFASLKKALSSS